MREHAPQNVMTDPGEVGRFYDRCSDLMRELLDGLSETPGRPRPFPQIEDAIGWPRRRIASVLGGVSHLRHTEFGGRRPYRFLDEKQSASRRWEMWMDADHARVVTLERVVAFARSGTVRGIGVGTPQEAVRAPEDVSVTKDPIWKYGALQVGFHEARAIWVMLTCEADRDAVERRLAEEGLAYEVDTQLTWEDSQATLRVRDSGVLLTFDTEGLLAKTIVAGA